MLNRAAVQASVLISAILVSLGWNYYAGRDLSWDLMNYHYYIPRSLFDDRLYVDYFPASIQSYLNPVGFSPFYFLVTLSESTLLVSSLLAMVHGINFYLLYLIYQKLLHEKAAIEGGGGRGIVFLSLLLGCCTAMVWQLIGSSHIEMIALIPFLVGLNTLLKPSCQLTPKLIIVAGLLIGVAVGLKLVFAVFAVVATIFVVGKGSLLATLTKIAYFSAAGLVGGLISAGYWMYLMWDRFGNPFFPLMNGFFRSPNFYPESFSHVRFQVNSLYDFAILPFKMLSPYEKVYTETSVPDVRFLILYAVALLIILKISRFFSLRYSAEYIYAGLYSVRGKFLLFFGASFTLWCFVSGNGRYGVVLFLLIGAAIAILCIELFGVRLSRMVMLVCTICQLVMVATVAETRSRKVEWSLPFLPFEVPNELKESPYLYLGADIQTHSILLHSLHPDSGMVNLRGQYSLESEYPHYQEVEKLFELYGRRAKALISFPMYIKDSNGMNELISVYSGVYKRFGFSLSSHCLVIKPMVEGGFLYHLYACDLYKKENTDIDRNKLEEVNRIFSDVESACPFLFIPKGATSVYFGESWERYYVSTDVKLFLKESDGVVTAKNPMTLNPILLARRISDGTFELYKPTDKSLEQYCMNFSKGRDW